MLSQCLRVRICRFWSDFSSLAGLHPNPSSTGGGICVCPTVVTHEGGRRARLSHILGSTIPRSVTALLIRGDNPTAVFLLFQGPLSGSSPFLQCGSITRFYRSIRCSPGQAERRAVIPCTPAGSCRSPDSYFSDLPGRPPWATFLYQCAHPLHLVWRVPAHPSFNRWGRSHCVHPRGGCAVCLSEGRIQIPGYGSGSVTLFPIPSGRMRRSLSCTGRRGKGLQYRPTPHDGGGAVLRILRPASRRPGTK